MLLLFSEVFFFTNNFCIGSCCNIKGNQVYVLPRFMCMPQIVCWLVFGGGGVLHEGEKYYGEKTGWAREIECHVIVDG